MLPDQAKKSRPYWGFVEMVTTRIEDVKTALKGEEYDNATKGHQRKPPARALGKGVYRIIKHYTGKKVHTHFIYKFEFPPEDSKHEPQESLNVEREGSFLIQIKNPDQHGRSQFGGLQNKRKTVFSAHLQGQFGHLRYCPANPLDFLNYEGCEFLLISASDDIEEELGLELMPEGETELDCSDLLKTQILVVDVVKCLRGDGVQVASNVRVYILGIGSNQLLGIASLEGRVDVEYKITPPRRQVVVVRTPISIFNATEVPSEYSNELLMKGLRRHERFRNLVIFSTLFEI
ncbi:hypothetical protein NE237_022194 [Protea cynaroides]|uniref:Uncharacterized protein n=1 Tax=Protea cynaroides TaxID=273540 RepID=A0A9Q0K519_9MAGN|nr:hypothetical protein NE237_022194 [Protea cynaroides]